MKKIRKENATYEIPDITLQSKTKRILALDPGSRNMGISLVATNGAKYKVIANSIVTNPLHDLTNIGIQRKLFLDEIDGWINQFQPDGIIAERFQTRGLQGPLVELVSVMLGLLASYKVPVKFITAATWKNAWHRRFDPLLLDDLYKTCLTTPHQLDASFIGFYGLELGLGIDIDYDPHEVIKQVEQSSLVRLINRKSRF